MSLYKEQLDAPLEIRGKRKSGFRKWAKNQMNRFIRRIPWYSDKMGERMGKKPTKFWQY